MEVKVLQIAREFSLAYSSVIKIASKKSETN